MVTSLMDRPIKKNYSKSGVFLSNTVLERGLVLAPVVVMGTGLKNAVAISIVFTIITFFGVLISRTIPDSVPYVLKAIINTMIAAGLFIPASMLIRYIFPDIIVVLGIFLPILVTNSLVVQKSGSRFHKENMTDMILDLGSHILGFNLVICLVGLVREFLGTGMIWGRLVSGAFDIPALSLPFSGFIIIGFFAAAMQRIKIKRQRSND